MWLDPTSSAIALWRRGASVRRFHTVDTLVIDTVGKHTGGVAYICAMLMGEDLSVNLLMAALLHDLPEYEVGDVPSPTKKLMSRFDALEKKVYEKHGVKMPPLTTLEMQALNYADAADGTLFCVEELSRGNFAIHSIHTKYLGYLHMIAKKFPEVPHIEEVHQAIVDYTQEVLRGRAAS